MILKETKVDAYSELQRSEQPYDNLSEKFKYASKDFTKQFAHIYAARINIFKDRLMSKALKKWGDSFPVKILSELTEAENQKCVVIGTLYKHQELKPSVLKELSEEHQLVPQPPRKHYTSPDDILILEDATQRIRLIGTLEVTSLATGIVIAVLGHENEDGRFEVEDYCFPGVESVPRSVSACKDDCFVVLVSGLELSSAADLLSVELFTDWVTGVTGGTDDQSLAAKIARVILAGNSVGVPPLGEVLDVGAIGEPSVLETVKLLDNVLEELSRSVSTDIMPGEFDPSNHTLPQQPLHPCLFPIAAKLQSLRVVSNPYQLSVGGRIVLGTSGQSINNLARVTDNVEPLALLTATLEWGHIAPTAPDTLGCYPYYQTDPFVMDDLPDIYFAGNQPSFQTSLVHHHSGKETRVICIPSFASTKQCVLVNLKNLNCHSITFSAGPPPFSS